MTQFDPQVAALFAALDETFAHAEPNTGEGAQGEWPPEGDHDFTVLSVHARADTIKGEGGMKIPVLVVQFEYEWDRTRENCPTWHEGMKPLVFKGEPFRLVPGYEKVLSGGSQMAAKIAEERFKGHCSKILRRDKSECTRSGECVQAVQSLLASTRVMVNSRVQYRETVKKDPATGKPKEGAKPTIYKTEFILDRIA